MKVRWALTLSAVALTVSAQAGAGSLSGVTFAENPGQVFVPLREVAKRLELNVDWHGETEEVWLGDLRLPESEFASLLDGTKLLPLRDLEKLGATVSFDDQKGEASVTYWDKSLTVECSGKRVEVSIKDQKLRAWQGDLLVLETRVSTGRPGHETPRGRFKAGPVKARMHRSRLYDDAPMPWSVQVNGDVFIHGYTSVPRYPASHGCIRMPLRGANPAKWFYHWVDLGTPVVIAKAFPTEATNPKP